MLDFFEIAFAVLGIWFAITIVIRKFFAETLKDKINMADFTAFMGIVLILYSITGILVMLFMQNRIHKFWMFLFAISPFIIGKSAKYETEKIFSIIQFVIIVASFIFISFVY